MPLLGSLSKDIYDKKNDDVLEEKFESDGFFLVKNSEKEWINYFKNGGEQPHSMLNKATFCKTNNLLIIFTFLLVMTTNYLFNCATAPIGV